MKHLVNEVKIRQLQEQNEALRDRIELLEECLGLYAEPTNWGRIAGYEFRFSPGWGLAKKAIEQR